MPLFSTALKKAPDGKLQDGRGLILVKQGETGRWVYRYSLFGRRREMGLGSWPQITLAEARKLRDRWALVLASGKDPIDVRDAEREEERRSRENTDPSLEEVVHLVFEARKASLRGDGIRGRWMDALNNHLLPKLGKKPISQVTARDLLEVFKPIWKTKHPTANHLMIRTRLVLSSAKRMGLPANPDILYALQEMLGPHFHETKHKPSIPWRDIPKVYQELEDTSAGNCNRFIILTLVRPHGCVGARTSEIDFENKIWTLPADRVKGRLGSVRDFRVPLSQPAMEFADLAKKFGTNFLFPSYGSTGHVTGSAISRLMTRNKLDGVPHGFRTSFRTWVQDTDACSWEVAERVLDHAIGGVVERSYARSDLLEQRRAVLDRWATYVTTGRMNG
jgi:integrase